MTVCQQPHRGSPPRSFGLFMGVGAALPDDLSGSNPMDPGQIAIPDGDGERIIPATVEAMRNELTRLRSLNRQHAQGLREAATARDLALARVKELEPAASEVDRLKPIADRWHEHERTQNDKLKEANAAAIATLTPEQRAAFDGVTDEPTIARMLTLVKAPTPAAPATPAAPPSYPAGGAAPVTGSGAGAELTPAEEAWVRSERKDLLTAGVEASTIKAMYKKFGPK